MTAPATGQEPLFTGGPEPLDPPTLHPRTAAANARAQTRIDHGIHPLNALPLAGNGHTCGDCIHRRYKQLAGRYPKCELGPITAGPGTDVRAWWPACRQWVAIP